jgi:hypothetical protein
VKVGDVLKVYGRVRDRDHEETCSHGYKHRVTVYIVKRIRVVNVRSEWVQALNYVSDGFGDVLYAVDTQGRTYRKEPHWDGPRASLWVRTDKQAFDQYPMHRLSRDLAGNVITELLPCPR